MGGGSITVQTAVVRRLATLHEYSEDLEEPERAHAASDRAKTGPGKFGF